MIHSLEMVRSAIPLKVFLTVCLKVPAQSACPEDCCQASAESVSINIMAVNQDLGSGGKHDWIVAKADDVMVLNPSVIINVIGVPY